MPVDVANILEKYFAAAKAARDGEFFVQCRQRKPYLTREIVERWGIGKAPMLKQCLAVGGLTEAELSAVGLLRQGEHGGAWMHFRDAMVFPYVEGERTVYVSSRRLVDHDPQTGEELPKEKKALSAFAPDANGFGGLERPAGFNLDALARPASPSDPVAPILLVEGVLDAIACCERGHPAVAYLGGSIRADLASLLRERFPAGEGVFVAPDATKDVTPRKRAELAGCVGPRARVVLLPEGWDPDDVENSGDYEGPSWEELMARAPDALTCWIGLFAGDPDAWPADLTKDFNKICREWLEWSQEVEEDLWGAAQTCFGWLDTERAAWMAHVRGQKVSVGSEGIQVPGGQAKVEGPLFLPGGGVVEERDEEAQRAYLDGLPNVLAQLNAKTGTLRDDAVRAFFGELAPNLAGWSVVTKERIKEEVCNVLNMGKRAYDGALKEGRQAWERKTGKVILEDIDWESLAGRFVESVRSGSWVLQ